MSEDRAKVIASIVFITVIVAVVSFLIFYRDTKTVTVDYLRWRYHVNVQYDVTSLSCDTDSKGHTSCTNHTTTYTRCSTGLQGFELPPVRPTVGCYMFPGDYIRENVYYDVFYNTDGGSVSNSSINADQWNQLQPKHSFKIETDAFNRVVLISSIGR